MNICTGSYDIPTAFLEVDGVYTNKAPGGVSYRCSFRVTEAVYFIEIRGEELEDVQFIELIVFIDVSSSRTTVRPRKSENFVQSLPA